MRNAATTVHVDHACILKWLNLKPPVARKLVRRLVFWPLVVSLNYLTKFHDFSMIIQVFFRFHEFSMHGTFFSDFPGFPWFPELVGTLTWGQNCLPPRKTICVACQVCSTHRDHHLNRVPTEIQKRNSMIFPWFSMINNVISMTI